MDPGFIKPSVCSIKATGGEPNYYKQACRNNRRGLILQKEKVEFRTGEILLYLKFFHEMLCCYRVEIRHVGNKVKGKDRRRDGEREGSSLG